jgi:hypothetical protein
LKLLSVCAPLFVTHLLIRLRSAVLNIPESASSSESAKDRYVIVTLGSVISQQQRSAACGIWLKLKEFTTYLTLPRTVLQFGHPDPSSPPEALLLSPSSE